MNAQPKMSPAQAMQTMRDSLRVIEQLRAQDPNLPDPRTMTLPAQIAARLPDQSQVGALNQYIQQTNSALLEELAATGTFVDRGQGAAPSFIMGMSQDQGDHSFRDMAMTLAAQGRFGDSQLAHVNPEEAMLLKAIGGAGTINPATGLPEYWGGSIGRAISRAVSSVGNAVSKVASSPVFKAVQVVFAVVTQQYWLAALTLASMVPGPVGQIAGIASAVYGMYSLGSGIYDWASSTGVGADAAAKSAEASKAAFAKDWGNTLGGNIGISADTGRTLSGISQGLGATSAVGSAAQATGTWNYQGGDNQMSTTGTVDPGFGGIRPSTTTSGEQRPSIQQSSARAMVGTTQGEGGETGDVDYTGFGGTKSGQRGAFRAVAKEMG